MRRLRPAAALGGLLLLAAPALPAAPSWYKGNTHAHTKASDGDSPLEDVCPESPARFDVPSGTAYVRAKVTADDGTAAWLHAGLRRRAAEVTLAMQGIATLIPA